MNTSNRIIITECPRDAMQGLKSLIETEDKITYLNLLLQAGFDVLDFGSFVSAKAIPQLADTHEVAQAINWKESKTELLAIIGNIGGAERAIAFPFIKYLGYPHSVSDTFLQRNINSNLADSLLRVKNVQEHCLAHNKTQVVYISMAFGNPYGDTWNPQIVAEEVDKLDRLGIKNISLADTIGEANPDDISRLFETLIPAFPHIEIGAHFHTRPSNWFFNVKAAYEAGCRKFDSAILGFGGCPMAKDTLTGNLPTENLVAFCEENQIETGINMPAFKNCILAANELFQGRS